MSALIFIITYSRSSFADRPLIEIEGATVNAYVLAIPSLVVEPVNNKELNILALNLMNSLKQDLSFINLFRILDSRSFFIDVNTEGFQLSHIQFENWKNVGAQGLIKGKIYSDSKNIHVEFSVYNISERNFHFQKKYSIDAKASSLVPMSHKFAGDLVYYFTKKRSIFDTKIVAIRKLVRNQDLMVMDFDGNNKVVLTNNRAINLLPSWAMKDSGIFFTSFISGKPEIYKLSLGKQNLAKIAGFRGNNMGVDVSLTGKLAFTLSKDGNSEIYVMNEDGTGLARLTDNWSIDTSASWSPDGSQIAFVSSRSGEPHIYTMNNDGTNQTRLTFQGNYNQTPDWSPIGDVIAFTARDERNRFDIFTVHIQTKKIIRLTQNQGNNEEPSFSPDGRHIVFVSDRDGKDDLYHMNSDGSHQIRITSGPGEYMTPSWSPWFDEKPM